MCSTAAPKKMAVPLSNKYFEMYFPEEPFIRQIPFHVATRSSQPRAMHIYFDESSRSIESKFPLANISRGGYPFNWKSSQITTVGKAEDGSHGPLRTITKAEKLFVLNTME
jgi:hypothetical protein